MAARRMAHLVGHEGRPFAISAPAMIRLSRVCEHIPVRTAVIRNLLAALVPSGARNAVGHIKSGLAN